MSAAIVPIVLSNEGSNELCAILGYYKDQTVFLLCPNDECRDLYAAEWLNEKRDMGLDLRFPKDIILPAGCTTSVDLGVRAACFRGYQHTGFWLAARSSFTKTPQVLMLRNFMGAIDRGYRGTLIAKVHNFGPGDYQARRGESLFQILEPMMSPPISVLVSKEHPEFVEGATIRGAGGFGSTGSAGQAAATPAAEK